MIDGVYRYASERKWQVQCFETLPRQRELNELLRTWRPIGCLVTMMALSSGVRSRFGDVPVVYQGYAPWSCLNVRHDAAAVTSAAVDELRRGNPVSWGFFGAPGEPKWSREKQLACTRLVAAAGGSVSSFPFQRLTPGTDGFRKALKGFLVALPKPAAVLIAADHLAGQVIEAAADAGIRMPDELALASIDNDERICENLSPTLTSVAPDFEGSGYAMCKLLDRAIANPALRAERVLLAPLGIVRRASTRRTYESHRIDRAIEFIRRQATQGIGVPDVARELGCGRRQAERIFRRTLGRKILDVLQDARFDAVFTLLKDETRTISEIAGLCGFRSKSHLQTLFKRRVGTTMAEWRRENRVNG